ncbi:MAG: tetratricopeptide repeat protein [Deltaproteobacteria bacterium]|nr:tetratricopeptide repeat protein [Deltaproteobacteria bacterium]
MRYFVWLVVLASLFCSAGSAMADDKALARVKFKAGIAAYAEGEFEEAVASFRAANQLFASWKLNYNIGQCEAALKHYGLAIESFERYLAQGGDEVPTERRDEVLGELDRLRKMVGDVEVEAPDGITVMINGVDRGQTPLPTAIRVTAGIEHDVQLMRDGEELSKRKVVVGGGQRTMIEFEEQPERPAPVEDEPPVEEAQPVEVDGDNGGISPVPFWVGLGATAAFGGTTLVLHFVTDSKIDDIKANPDDGGLRDSGKALQATGITFLVLTGVVAVTTGVLAGFTDFGGDDEEPGETEVSLVPWSDGQGGGLGVAGRF